MNWLEYALLYASIFYVYVFVYAPSLFLIAACLGSLWFSYQVWNSGKKLLSVFFVFLAIVFAVLAYVIYRQIIYRWKNLRSDTVSKTKRPILSDGLFALVGLVGLEPYVPFAQSSLPAFGAGSPLVSRQQTQVACLRHSTLWRRFLRLPPRSWGPVVIGSSRLTQN